MYPWLHLGPITVSTYSVLFLCAFIVGGIMTYYEVKRQHRASEVILRVALGALIGGVLGAKLSMIIFWDLRRSSKIFPTCGIAVRHGLELSLAVI